MERILNDEKKIYSLIYSLEEKKGDAIISKDADQLTKISNEQEILIGRINDLERLRTRQLEQIAENRSIRYEGALTLSAVIASMKNETEREPVRQLAETGRELRELLVKISEKQAVNDKMLADNVEFYNLMVAGLRDEAGGTGYGRNGRGEVKRGGSLIFNITA